MKKNIFAIAVAAFALCMASCQKDEPINIIPTGNGGNTTPTENNARVSVKSTSDLHNTDWTYTVTYFEFLDNLGIDTTCMQGFDDDTMSFGLNFDGTYAHFSFPDNIMAFAGEGEMQQISGVSYEYSYDGTTHTGYLVVAAEDADGNDVPAQLEFTYDDDTDVITFELPMAFAMDTTEFTLTLNFARNNE